MRGPDHQQSAMFSYLSPEQRVPSDYSLRAVHQMADTILAQMSQLFSKMYSGIGRPSIPEKLLRALLLQVLYTVLSEHMLRRVIDTTDAVESLHMSLRKIIKTWGSSPSEEAAAKQLYLALRNVIAKWDTIQQ